MTETKINTRLIIPELEFLLRMPICSEKQVAEDSRYLNGFKKCERCNGTKGYAEFLGCENYKEIGEK